MQVKIKKLHKNAVIPSYAHEGDACFDLTAATVEGLQYVGKTVTPECPIVCETGLVFDIPAGHVMLVFSRSGHGFNDDIRLANCVGVIDSTYKGEVKVKLTSDAPYEEDSLYLAIKPGDRVAQAMIIPVEAVEFKVVDELSESARGAGGFGSTGT